MAKDTKETINENIEETVIIKSRIRKWWDTNKSKLTWFGIGALAGAGTLLVTAVLVEPADEQYEGDDEETVTIDTSLNDIAAS